MPMPHRTQMQLIKRRLTGKEGTARIKELHSILADLPNYRNGPYADIRKWVHQEIANTRTRGRVVHRDSIAVPREGAAQIALVGAPNAGKSSLLQALSRVQIKTGDYAFTTTRPVPVLTRVAGVLLQLVEIPGLLPGAADGRAGGRALLGVLRGADGMVLCHSAAAPPGEIDWLIAELDAAGIDVPYFVAATKSDEAPAGAVDGLARHLGDGVRTVPVSVLDDDALDVFASAVFELTGLVRIYPRKDDEIDEHPLALQPPVTVVDVAAAIHGELAATCRGARVWGPSARFEGQRVGRSHALVDGDVVELLT